VQTMTILRRRNLLGVNLIWVLGLLSTFSQSAEAQLFSSSEAHAPVLKVEVDLVTLNFSVLEKGRRGIGNLHKDDITISEDEIAQEITFFDSDPLPLALVVLLDVSESMAPFSKQLADASRVLPGLLDDQDSAAVITFSDFPQVIQDFTQDKQTLRKALQTATDRFSGATNINDALYMAALKLEDEAPGQRKAILLLSDGQGNRGERERAFSHLKSCGAALLGVGLGLTSRLYRGVSWMARWTTETGGDLVFYSSDLQLRNNLQAVLDSVRSRYSAAYVPKNQLKDGGFRRLKVAISGESSLASRQVIIKSPEGYYAPAGTPHNP